ncbi:class I adenylate cyclase, partial [Thermodesulfobacteriota bacterium]
MTGFLKNLLSKILDFFGSKERSEDDIRLDTFFDREQAFSVYNSEKINNILRTLPVKKREVFRLIPILLCYNDPVLPGYIHSRTAMHGISNFSISPEDKRLLMKYFKKSSLKSSDTKGVAVELLALIGSMGSVAQTEESDLDFWVCTTFEHFSEDQISHFKTKLREVEEWADKVADLEVHFFLMDSDKVHSNEFGETGGESSGSALAKLLKEEFYRTAVYVCGKLPYWCIVPPDADDEEYAEDIDFLKQFNHFSFSHYIDIGNVYQISKNEFFGAALWEIVKGWRFPFKSILKMALLEKYLSSDLTSELLCNSLKSNVFKDPRNPKNDPYILLFDSILDFHKQDSTSKDLEIIKTCFYIKTHLKGSEILTVKSQNDIKDERTKRYYKAIKSYIDHFNWDLSTHRHLETFQNWTVKEANSFLSKIDTSMLNMYKNIMQIVKVGESIVISDKDLTIIGRKIHSIFRKVPCKIPFVASLHNAGNVGSIVLHEETKGKWNLHFGTKRILNPILAAKDVVYSANNIFEIIAWIAMNEYYKERMYLFV